MLQGNYNQTGGREIHQDDIRILQSELLTAIQDQYKGQGAFILSGCLVSGTAGNYTIAAGLVYIDGMVMKFDQVTSISSFPQYIHQATPVNQDNFPLELGGTAYKRTLYKSELVSSIPGSGEYIIMTSTGGRTFNDVLAGSFVRLSGNQTINGTKTFTSTIAGSINGNAHTVDNGAYVNANNNFTGNNTFSNTIAGNINGNAHTVDGGVYMTGDQSIGGTKTFSSTINGNLSGNVTGNLIGNADTATNASNLGGHAPSYYQPNDPVTWQTDVTWGTNYAASTGVGFDWGYKLSRNGTHLEFKGAFNKGSFNTPVVGEIAFTLPSGYRPSVYRLFPIILVTSANGAGSYYGSISPSGQFTVYQIGTGTGSNFTNAGVAPVFFLDGVEIPLS